MWQMRLEAGKQLLRQATDAATYWMGLVHYESGNYSAAAQWLSKVIEAESPSQWLSGARYNLGRTHEQLGQWEEAQRMYRADVSPQQHGSLLRARALRLRTEAGQASDASSADSGSR
jgi:tetratricopeptide (TPR) repeat protein